MGYVNSTPSQALRVAGAWVASMGAVLLILTSGEFRGAGTPSGAIAALGILASGSLALAVGTWRWRTASRVDRRFFSENAGTEILAQRRRWEVRLCRARNGAIIITVLFGVAFVILGSTLTCLEGVCQGPLPAHKALLTLVRLVSATAGTFGLILASLARIHAAETDRWEDLSSEAMRRRDEGPTPGLKTSRWE